MRTTEAVTLARRLMRELGVPNDWRVVLDDRPTRRFGQCRYHQREIGLSTKLVRLNAPEQVEATIRHEIAHALVGPGHGHDATWKRMARRCGDDGERCYGNDVVVPKGKWQATCADCGKVVYRHRRPQRGSLYKHNGCKTFLKWRAA